MICPGIPQDEGARLEALQALNILDSPPSALFDSITRFLAEALDIPIVLVSLVDSKRQWFKSRVGLEATETPREISFCGHVVCNKAPLVVSDARLDQRFAGNPLVTGSPHVRAYAGTPLRTRQGHVIGTLCAIDSEPREFDSIALQHLTEYGTILQESIQAQELANATDKLLQFATQRERLFRSTFEQAAVGMLHCSPNGEPLRVNQRLCTMLGYSLDEMQRLNLGSLMHPTDMHLERLPLARLAQGEIEDYRAETRFKHKDGHYVWTEVSSALTRDPFGAPDYIISVLVDVDARKQAETELESLRHSLQSQVTAQTEQLREQNQALEQQIGKVRASESAARLATNQLKHFHYALDLHASVAVTDTSGVITYANQKLAELSGYARTELMGKTHALFSSGTHEAGVMEKLWNTVLSGAVWRGELCNKTKTGKHFWVDKSIVPFHDEHGRITQFVSIGIDITEQKRDQELLIAEELKSRQINERLRQIADGIPAMIAYWDRTEICRFANSAHIERFGLTPKQIVGMSIESLFGPTLDAKNRGHMAAALKGERQQFDHSVPDSTGVLRHWQTEYLPHCQDGEVCGFYAFVVDITDRKNAEDKLCRQEALLSATSRMGEIGGWSLQKAGKILEWSEMIYRIHELPVGRNVTLEEAFEFHPEESKAIMTRAVREALENAKHFDLVTPLVTARGNHRWVRCIGEPQTVEGAVVRVIGAFQDVTEQKRLEQELTQAQKLESIGQLSAGIAHEINTPTQFIGDNLSFLKTAVSETFASLSKLRIRADSQTGATLSAMEINDVLRTLELDYYMCEVPRCIEQTLEGVGRIQAIVGAMKEFSHPGTEKIFMDLNHSIKSTVVVASSEWKHVADIVMQLDDHLPLVAVIPGGFNQAILNMIVNAAHSIDETAAQRPGKGTITLSTRADADWVEIQIRDTGAGIPEAILNRIFDPFFTTKPVGKGTGQGLAIAHDVIVNKHGGTIAVESNVGVGTAFTLRLPISKAQAL